LLIPCINGERLTRWAKWSSEELGEPFVFFKHLKLIGYVRIGQGVIGREQQLEVMKKYCQEHSHRLLAIYYDEEDPSVGLASALLSLDDVDGMMAHDLTRFVPDSSDALQALSSLVTNKFLNSGKKIISVTDGCDNMTGLGLENLMNYLNLHANPNHPTEASLEGQN
jgi:hypothetical protein